MKKILFIALVGISIHAQSQTTDATILPVAKKISMYSQMTLGGMVGNEGAFSFQSVNGIELNRKWGFGVGMGLETFRYQKYTPFFLDVRYHFLKGENSPYVSLMGGYSASYQSTDFSSIRNYGLTGGLSVGMRMFFSKHIGITSSVGIRYSYYQQPPYYFFCMDCMEDQMYKTTHELYRAEMKVGLIFR